MKYFLHVDYKEGITGGWFCKKRHYLELVSIAIVSEEGKEFESVSHRELPYEIYGFLRDGRISGEEYADLYSYRSPEMFVAFKQVFYGYDIYGKFANKDFYDLRQELDRVNASFTNDYSLAEDSDFPFIEEGMSAIQKARKYKELYEFLEAKK